MHMYAVVYVCMSCVFVCFLNSSTHDRLAYLSMINNVNDLCLYVCMLRDSSYLSVSFYPYIYVSI